MPDGVEVLELCFVPQRAVVDEGGGCAVVAGEDQVACCEDLAEGG